MRRFYSWLFSLFNKSRKNQVLALVQNVASLELTPEEVVVMKAPPGFAVYGNIVISGNSIPQITYQVFDESYRDFVQVYAFASLPDKISSKSMLIKTDDNGQNPIPTEIETKPIYLSPFWFWLDAVTHYFPILKESRIPKVSNYV